MVTAKGFKRIATMAGTSAREDGDGYLSAVHPVTEYVLVRSPTGGVSVHASYGSWDSGENALSALTAIWKGR
jgi:hypothetical protein